MPDENMACCAPTLGRSLQDFSAKCASTEVRELDRLSQGLEELFQRLMSQYSIQEEVITKILGSVVVDEKNSGSPECPPNGKIDALNRQLYKCLNAMSMIENSFTRIHKL